MNEPDTDSHVTNLSDEQKSRLKDSLKRLYMPITVPVMRQQDTHRSFVWTPSMATCRYSLQTYYQCVIKEELPTVHPEVDISHEISIPACYKHSRAPRARGCTYRSNRLTMVLSMKSHQKLKNNASERFIDISCSLVNCFYLTPCTKGSNKG